MKTVKFLDKRETIVNCYVCGRSFLFKMNKESYTVEKAMKKGRRLLIKHYKKDHEI